MASFPEELDWHYYEAFGLLTEEDRKLHDRAHGEALPDLGRALDQSMRVVERSGLFPGHRAFEVVLARDSLTSGVKTAWFARNGYRSPSEITSTYAPAYQRLIEARVAIIDRNPSIRLIEQPEHKRRWTLRDYAAETRQAARQFLLGRMEKALEQRSAPTTTRELALEVLRDAKAQQVASVLFDADADAAAELARLALEDAVPHLAVLRFNDLGMEKHEKWERTWDLQRREDAGEQVGEIPVPPKYDTKDYRDLVFWRLRGKLDVPKERLISYPGAERDDDKSPLVGWAGWDHLQRAQALAALYQERKTQDGWGADRLTPLLAGLLELVPWLKQWHDEPNEEFGGERLGSYIERFVRAEAQAIEVSLDDLRAWRPVKGARGRKKEAR